MTDDQPTDMRAEGLAGHSEGDGAMALLDRLSNGIGAISAVLVEDGHSGGITFHRWDVTMEDGSIVHPAFSEDWRPEDVVRALQPPIEFLPLVRPLHPRLAHFDGSGWLTALETERNR